MGTAAPGRPAGLRYGISGRGSHLDLRLRRELADVELDWFVRVQAGCAVNAPLPSDSGAEIRGPYRYRLWRRFADGPVLLWVMLNPSTADERLDDPTIRKCVGFSERWGYGGIMVVNLFALRATDPRELRAHPTPEGFGNDLTIRDSAGAYPEAVCAWGRHGSLNGRGIEVRQVLLGAGGQPTHLGLTKDGQPKHPLYLRYSTERTPWGVE